MVPILLDSRQNTWEDREPSSVLKDDEEEFLLEQISATTGLDSLVTKFKLLEANLFLDRSIQRIARARFQLSRALTFVKFQSVIRCFGR